MRVREARVDVYEQRVVNARRKRKRVYAALPPYSISMVRERNNKIEDGACFFALFQSLTHV